MKNITLSQVDQDKLIEIANKLFPDRNWHFWFTEEDNDPYPLNQMFGHNRCHTLGKREGYKAVEIHWLEFVILHVIPRIHDQMVNPSLSDLQIHFIRLLSKGYITKGLSYLQNKIQVK